MIKLEKIVDGLEMVDDINDCYYNPENEEIFFSNIGDYQDITVDELDELFDKSIILPTRYEINEYQMMKDFIETIKNEDAKNNLQMLIQGKGAFKRFKDYCQKNLLINDWYSFRNVKYESIAKDWCEKNQIEYEK